MPGPGVAYLVVNNQSIPEGGRPSALECRNRQLITHQVVQVQILANRPGAVLPHRQMFVVWDDDGHIPISPSSAYINSDWGEIGTGWPYVVVDNCVRVQTWVCIWIIIVVVVGIGAVAFFYCLESAGI
jgi:hypothetical protein